jgi:hypothetical protein
MCKIDDMGLKKIIYPILLATSISGCGSVVVLDKAELPITSSCQVKVWTSKESALQEGKIQELCLITGTSSMSFSHTVGTAIEKNKLKACECGATNVYIQTQDPGTLGTASVSLVAFKFVQK